MKNANYQGIIQYCDKDYRYYTYECNTWYQKEKAIKEIENRKKELEKKGYKAIFAAIEIKAQETIKWTEEGV